MKKYIKLSYNLNTNTPVYPGNASLKLKRVKAISKGDSCNTYTLSLSNHIGSHIDAPRHFFESGVPIGECKIGELVFKRPVIFDCSKKANEPIRISDLEKLNAKDADAILIRTGFYVYRNKDREKYSRNTPYLLPETAAWIRKNFLSLRLLGIDCISVSSFFKRGAGREVHRTLLQKKGHDAKPSFILEDIFIPAKIKKICELIVVPLFVDAIDSAPCTVIGVCDD